MWIDVEESNIVKSKRTDVFVKVAKRFGDTLEIFVVFKDCSNIPHQIDELLDFKIEFNVIDVFTFVVELFKLPKLEVVEKSFTILWSMVSAKLERTSISMNACLMIENTGGMFVVTLA